MTSIETRIETITPEAAKGYLIKNTRNRKVGGVNYNKIKTSLQRGEWKLNGEAIKIASDGTILDGQHRLMASAETGVSFETLIVTGLPYDTQDTMDTGKTRTLADVLTLNGWKSGTIVAAVVAAIVRTEKYGLRAAFGSNSGWTVTNKEALDRLDNEPAIADVAAWSSRMSRLGLHGRTSGALFYVFSKIDAEDTEFFFARLQSGDGLVTGDSILTLRNLLIAHKSSRGTLPQSYLAAVTIKAWNKFRAGEQCVQLKFTLGGANPERFPEPK